jgi:hypothetical protein
MEDEGKNKDDWLKGRILSVAKHWTIGVVYALAVVAQ